MAEASARGPFADWNAKRSSQDAEDEVNDREQPDLEHDSSQAWPDDSVAHAGDQEHEEAQRVPRCVENGDENEESSSDTRVANIVEVGVVAPDHEHLHHEEEDGGSDVVLDGKEVSAVLVGEVEPSEAEREVDEEEDEVELLASGQRKDAAERERGRVSLG